jgi:hypothetical protein
MTGPLGTTCASITEMTALGSTDPSCSTRSRVCFPGHLLLCLCLVTLFVFPRIILPCVPKMEFPKLDGTNPGFGMKIVRCSSRCTWWIPHSRPVLLPSTFKVLLLLGCRRFRGMAGSRIGELYVTWSWESLMRISTSFC